MYFGIRCSNTDFAYAIMTGSKSAPVVDVAERVAFPSGFSSPEILRWIHQEVTGLLDGRECEALGIKKAEAPVKRSNALEDRTQCEGVIALAVTQAGCLVVERRVKASIAKGLGLKGKAKYLTTKLDTSVIAGFDDYPDKVKEAILVAWSCM